jgi:hypothetical protein
MACHHDHMCLGNSCRGKVSYQRQRQPQKTRKHFHLAMYVQRHKRAVLARKQLSMRIKTKALLVLSWNEASGAQKSLSLTPYVKIFHGNNLHSSMSLHMCIWQGRTWYQFQAASDYVCTYRAVPWIGSCYVFTYVHKASFVYVHVKKILHRYVNQETCMYTCTNVCAISS